MNTLKSSQSGFTLVELIVVIVLLGILGVTALGKFQDLSGNAADAVEQGIANELAGASNVNYAKGLVSGTYPVTLTASNVCSTTILNNLLTGSIPAEITVSGTGDCSGGAGTTASCTLTHSKGSSTNATANLTCGG